MIRITRCTLYRALRAVSLFQSNDETRTHLHGVRFEHSAGKLEIVATDGHTLGRATLKAGSGTLQEFTLTTAQVTGLLPTLKCKLREDCEVTITVSDSPTAVQGDVSFDFPGGCWYSITEQDFPPWRQVTPERASKKDKSCALFALNPLYFARAGKAAEYFVGDKKFFARRGFEISTGNELDPVRFDLTHPDTGDLCVIIMPVRI